MKKASFRALLRASVRNSSFLHALTNHCKTTPWNSRKLAKIVFRFDLVICYDLVMNNIRESSFIVIILIISSFIKVGVVHSTRLIYAIIYANL